MKRAVLFTLFLAVVAVGAFWVQVRHDGDLELAWTDAKALVGLGAPPAPPQAGERARSEGPRVAVVSAVAKTMDLPITRTGVGWIEPIATVTVRARIDGQILEQRVTDGQTVAKGDVLFRIDDREIQAQIARDEATLQRDLASQAKAEADLKRAQDLVLKNIVSQAQIDQNAADAKIAAANVVGDRAALDADRIRLGYTTVTAPIAGRLGTIRVTPGNLVRGSDNTGDGLVTITQMKPLRVTFALPERDLDLVRAALEHPDRAPVRIYASGSTQALASGILSFVDSSVEQSSGTITVKALLPNEDGRLWPGQYVRAELDVGTHSNATTVPLVAIAPGQDQPFAYVVTPGKTVERRKVEIAGQLGEVAAVASGIKPGEHVVVEGQPRLRDGIRVEETVETASGASGAVAANAAQDAAKKVR